MQSARFLGTVFQAADIGAPPTSGRSEHSPLRWLPLIASSGRSRPGRESRAKTGHRRHTAHPDLCTA